MFDSLAYALDVTLPISLIIGLGILLKRIGWITELFVERVPCFVKRAEEALRHPLVVDPGGDADVVSCEGDLKRVHSEIQTSPIGLIPQLTCHLEGEGELCLHGEGLLEKVYAGRLLFADGPHQRKESLPERREEGLQ